MKKFEINKILVPIDFSDHSINAYNTALTMAQRHEAHVKLLFVFDTDNNLYPESPVNNRYHYPGDAIRSLEELAVTAREQFQVSCDIAYVNGAITTAILQKAIETGSDIIIMGKNGHSGERALYAGSHTYDVIKKSHCPVLMVTNDKIHNSFSNILFPVRPVISMLEKYNIARPILTHSGGSLHLMAMRNPEEPNEVHIISKLMSTLKQQAEADLLDTRLAYYFSDNHFAKHVVDTLKNRDNIFDLVIVTAELDENVREFYLGDYTQQIIHQATVPVLVIRATTAPLPPDAVLATLEAENASFQQA